MDDDPLFGNILSKLAIAGNIHLEYVASLKKLDMENLKERYDLIITDYDLENLTGIQLIRVLEACNQILPTIMVSSYGKVPTGDLPPSVICSLNKSEGPQKILYNAVCAFQTLSKKKS